MHAHISRTCAARARRIEQGQLPVFPINGKGADRALFVKNGEKVVQRGRIEGELCQSQPAEKFWLCAEDGTRGEFGGVDPVVQPRDGTADDGVSGDF